MSERPSLSDGEILTRLDAISDDIKDIRADMGSWRAEWRNEFVAKLVYEADQRTAAEIRKQLERTDDEQGAMIVDLQAEASRKSRERRTMWTAIVAALAAALVGGMFSLVTHSQGVTVCVPTQNVSC